MAAVKDVRNHRGFVFCRLNRGSSFEDFGESLTTLDNMADRSPEGRLEVAGGVMRHMHRCNWKMLVDNQTDTCHPMVAHESRPAPPPRSGAGARRHAQAHGGGVVRAPSSRPMSSSRTWASAYGKTTATGVADSIHAAYSGVPGYGKP